MSLSPGCERWQHRRFSSVRRGLSADIDRYVTKSPENIELGNSFKRRLSAFLTPELLCLLLYRMAHWLHCVNWRRAAWVISRINALLHKVDLPPYSCIGPGCRLSHPAGVVFQGSAGRGLTLFGMAVCCAREEFLGACHERAPQLGDHVTLGAHAVVMGAISIGGETQVSPFACVTRHVPPCTVVAARAMRIRKSSGG
jgi:serine O-acetyltransferase